MATVQIKHPNDEYFEVLVDGKYIGFANHDEDGWAGMDKIEKLVEALAKALGADFEHIDR